MSSRLRKLRRLLLFLDTVSPPFGGRPGINWIPRSIPHRPKNLWNCVKPFHPKRYTLNVNSQKNRQKNRSRIRNRTIIPYMISLHRMENRFASSKIEPMNSHNFSPIFLGLIRSPPFGRPARSAYRFLEKILYGFFRETSSGNSECLIQV